MTGETPPAAKGATEALQAIVDFCDDPNGSESNESLGMGLARLLPAARTALSTPGAVKVKPIRWPAQCAKGKRVNADGAGWTYSIVHYGEPYIYRWAAEEGSWSEPFETYEGAKAAAQAHFETALLSALVRP